MKSKFPYRGLAGVIIAAAILWLASYFLIRNLGPMLGGIDETIGAIFGNLQTAVIRPSAVALFVIGACFLLLLIVSGGKKWIYALSPLFVIVGFVGALVFASINGVLFSDMLRILIGLVKNGLFEIL
jgi:hypothetical protein